MSIKQVVFEYLEKNEKSPLDQVVKGLPELNKASIKKYYYDFRKLKAEGKKDKKSTIKKRQSKPAGKEKPKNKKSSVRQRVFDLLAKNPDMGIDELLQKIEGGNRKTIRDYCNRWRKLNPPTKPQVSSKELSKEEQKYANEKKAVYDFMLQYPDANLNDLRNLFPHYKKLVTDFRSWKRQQPKNDTPAAKQSKVPDKKTIQSLKQVIRKQKVTIEAQRSKLKEVRSQLARTSKFSLDGLKSFLASKIFNK